MVMGSATITMLSSSYLVWLNTAQTIGEEEAVERSLVKSMPLGSEDWTDAIVRTFRLEQTLRPAERPKKGG